jgi:hypothetical protein
MSISESILKTTFDHRFTRGFFNDFCLESSWWQLWVWRVWRALHYSPTHSMKFRPPCFHLNRSCYSILTHAYLDALSNDKPVHNTLAWDSLFWTHSHLVYILQFWISFSLLSKSISKCLFYIVQYLNRFYNVDF